jgi:DNA-binding beta-propeller fold protein YncE
VGPVVGDIVTSAEGKLYFVSDKLYVLNPDGTPFAPAATIGIAATGPVVDDNMGVVYVAVSAADGGFDLMSFNKLLQNGTVALHVPKPPFGGGISPLLLGDGAVYFVAGRFPGVAYAAGAVQWSNPVCPSESGPNTPFGVSANGPALSADGSSLFIMCAATVSAAGGLFRLNAFTGEVIASVSSDRNSTEPALDSLQHVRSGWQAFGGAVFCGDYLTWDFSLTLLSPPSTLCDSTRFTTSRAAILPDGRSTVRIGFSFPPNNQLDAEGANNWIISTDNSTVPNFSSLPSVDAAGNVFIGNTQGIQARNALDGHVLWSFTTGDAITTQPVVANGGTLYVGSSSGSVYAFNTVPATQSGTVFVSGSGAGFATVDLQSASVVANNNSFTDGGVIRVSPDGTRSYVSAIFGLAVVDNATNHVVTTVSVGPRPAWIALSPDGSRIYVSQPNVSSFPGVAQGVYVVDASTNAVITIIPVPGPQRIAVAPDNSRVYVGSNGRGIAVIDPVTNTITHFIDILGSNTTGIAFTPDSARAYVGEIGGAGLYLIDARTDTFLQSISLPALGGGILDVVASPDGKKIYAANVRTSPVDPAHNVFVLDTGTNSAVGQIPVSFPGSQMAITSDGTNVLVGDSDTGELVVASIATDSVVETIHVNDPCCPVISGIGTRPPAALIPPPPPMGKLSVPTAINVGEIQQGTTTAFPVKLQNVGSGPLTITAFSIDNPAFQLSGVPPLPFTILAGNSVEVSLIFAPLSVGTFNGSLSITLAGNATAVTVVLSGVSVAPPILSVQTLSLDFGRTSTAETRKLSLTLSNLGGSTLSGAASIPATSEGAFSLLGNNSFVLAPGQSFDLTIAFTPIDNIAYRGMLSITSNAGDVAVMLVGQGERVGVLLVAGFGGDVTTFGLMGSLLTDQDGLRVFMFTSNTKDFDITSPASCHPLDAPALERVAGELAGCIHDIVIGGDPLSPGLKFDRVDIVAHSMGGLVSRAYIAGLAQEATSQSIIPYRGEVRKLIVAATPNYGVDPDLQILGTIFTHNGKEVAQMTYDASFLSKLDDAWRSTVLPENRINESDILAIVGTESLQGSDDLDDGVVVGASATLPCEFLSCTGSLVAQHVRYVPYSHSPGVPQSRGTGVVFVDSPTHQSFQIVESFVTEKQVPQIFTPPLGYIGNGLLFVRIVDETGKSVAAPGISLGVGLDGGLLNLAAFDLQNGAFTGFPVPAGSHFIRVRLRRGDYKDPDPFPVAITGGRATVQTVIVHRK